MSRNDSYDNIMLCRLTGKPACRNGRRGRLKICCGQPRAGSSPAAGIRSQSFYRLWVFFVQKVVLDFIQKLGGKQRTDIDKFKKKEYTFSIDWKKHCEVFKNFHGGKDGVNYGGK